MIKRIFILFTMATHLLSLESPLSLLQNDIKIIPDNQDYVMKYEISISQKNVQTFICFHETSYNITEQDETVSCSFAQISIGAFYKCFYLTDNTTNTSMTFDAFDYTYNPNERTLRPTTNDTLVEQFSTEQLIKFQNNYFQKDKFYKMLSCEKFYISSGQCADNFWKENYFHTFHDSFFAQNLIVQRFHQCRRFTGKSDSSNDFTYFINVFYGGVSRSNESIFFNAAVITRENGDNDYLNMWGAFAYSFDHFNRDGACFSTTTGNVNDFISLLAAAVYDDTADNIEAVDNVEVLSNSFRQDTKNYKSYFVQYYRYYNTEDFFGDEQIFYKIYPTFSFAGYFEHDNNTKQVSCFDQKFKHQIVFKYNVDLTLYSQIKFFFALVTFIFILL